MARLGKIARRGFLIGSVALAGGVAFGWVALRRPWPDPLTGDALPAGSTALTPYVLIDAAGVTVIAPRAEMGQGVQSTLAALVAEELDLDWPQVRVMHGPAAEAYYNTALLAEGVPFRPTDHGWLAETARDAMAIPAKMLGFQLTGGSTSIPDGFEKMRLAGATAREALVAAAARRLGVAAADLRTGEGAVIAPDGTRLPYTDLAVEAASVPLPDAPALRDRAGWRLLGTSLPRLDMAGKVTGTTPYTADLRLPGMRFATVRTNPHLGAAMTGHDPAGALAMPGVVAVVPLWNGVAVVADSTWRALQAAAEVRCDWATAPYPADSAAMEAVLAEALSSGEVEQTARDDGDIETVLDGPQAAGSRLEADYVVPFLAHATMEPMCAAGWLQDGRLQIWAGTQFPTMARDIAAREAGLDSKDVVIHTQPMGGAFGRRGEVDFIAQAAVVARALAGTPVLVTWSREEDMTHDTYRPMAMARVRGAVADGMVTGLHLATASPSITTSLAGRYGLPMAGPDATIVQGAWEQPYAIPAYRVTGHRAALDVPVGFWRSVGASQNAFFTESAVDELAHLAGVDPLLFRLRQMDHMPSIRVLEAVAEMCGWDQPAPSGRARGVAFCLSFGVPTAAVIEVADVEEGVRLTGAWIAADVGTALDPRNIEAQLSGGLIFGLSAAMRGEITFSEGKVVQQTFWDYEPMRLSQCPPISVRVLEGGGPIRGIGEPGTPPAAPALANAIFALTGQRHRRLPLSHGVRFA